MMKTQCPNCNRSITCTQNEACWCMSVPKALVVSNTEQCFCANCLMDKIAEGVNNSSVQLTPELRKEIIELGKPDEMKENVDYYMENGFFVMTTWYHLRKGYCCKNNCRHCAYR